MIMGTIASCSCFWQKQLIMRRICCQKQLIMGTMASCLWQKQLFMRIAVKNSWSWEEILPKQLIMRRNAAKTADNGNNGFLFLTETAELIMRTMASSLSETAEMGSIASWKSSWILVNFVEFASFYRLDLQFTNLVGRNKC